MAVKARLRVNSSKSTIRAGPRRLIRCPPVFHLHIGGSPHYRQGFASAHPGSPTARLRSLAQVVVPLSPDGRGSGKLARIPTKVLARIPGVGRGGVRRGKGRAGLPTGRYAENDPSGAVTDRVVLVEALARLPLRQRQATLAVPPGAQLLPQSAAVGPGGGVDQSTTGPVSYGADLLPGGTRVTHLSEPVTLTETGTATVELGSRPQGATGVGLVLDCLSAGEFTYPDGAGMICDTGAEPSDLEDFPSMAYVVDLDAGRDEVEIRATEGATWRLTAAYVSTEVTQWGVNAKGQTYGVENANGSPDLIAVVATNGQLGYAYVSDMNAAGGPAPTSPEDALTQQQERLGKTLSVNVYESDGETVIGEFVIGSSDPADGDDRATVTWIP